MLGGVGNEVAELPYTYRYFRELSPSLLSFALLSRSIAFDIDRPLRYLELGFGQGVSLNLHAAACDGVFWGNDYNPSHLQLAQELAAVSGADLNLTLDSFVELAAREDMPEFDIIALHGVWSWVSAEDRAAIVDLARRKLAQGGLLYVSYNCSTGLSAALPLRELLMLHASHEAATPVALAEKIDAALSFAQDLAQAGGGYFAAHPEVVRYLQSVADKDRAYASHELFGRNWHLSSFADICAQLDTADLRFAGSAMLLTHDHDRRLPPPAQAILSRLTSEVMREAARDAFTNTPFREDIFIRGGGRVLSAEARLARLRNQRFMLTTPYGALSPAVHWLGADINIATETNALIVKALRANQYAPKSLAEIEATVGRSAPQILPDIVVLVGAGFVQPVPRRRTPNALTRCDRINSFLCAHARPDAKVHALASPLLGAGLSVGWLHQMFLRALAEGKATPREQAEHVCSALNMSLGAAEDKGAPRGINDAERLAEDFSRGLLPILRTAQVVQAR